MKKFIVLFVLVTLVILSPLWSADGGKDSSFGLGLNLGTNIGLAIRADMGDFDIVADVGMTTFRLNQDTYGPTVDIAASWNYYTIDGGRGLKFDLTAGVGASMIIHLGSYLGTMDLDIIFPLGIEYDFAQLNDNVPILLYLRLLPGVQILTDSALKPNFGFGGQLGAVWVF